MRSRSIYWVLVAAVSALALATSAGAAGTDTRMPFTMGFDNPCTGEPFTASGFVHTTSDETFGLDGSAHIRYHVNLEGVTARGVLSGVKYVVQQEENDAMNSNGNQLTMDQVIKEHYVRARDDGTLVLGDDFYFFVHLHFTLNANGTPTALTMNTEDEPCQ